MQADSVTVSWCRFRYVSQTTHKYVNLVGANDTHTSDLGRLHLTYHHCWYDQNCNERMPSVRFGRVHVYNNYYRSDSALYCVRTRLYAECLVENNYFERVQNPWELALSIKPGTITGKVHAANNNISFMETTYGVRWMEKTYEDTLIITTLIPGIDTVFIPPYSYTPDNALDVKSMVIAGAGNIPRAGLALNTSVLDFGDVAVGDSKTLAVIATNTGTGSAISIQGVTSIAGYTVTPNPPAAYPITLAQGASQSFNVTFTPTSINSFTGNIVFLHDGSGGATYLSASGDGISSFALMTSLNRFWKCHGGRQFNKICCSNEFQYHAINFNNECNLHQRLQNCTKSPRCLSDYTYSGCKQELQRDI